VKMLMAWLAAKRWRLSALHLLEMWVVWLPCYFLFGQSIPAATAGVWAWYWSRKMTEVRALVAGPGHLIAAWKAGWFPWQWSRDLQIDFAVPAVASLGIALWAL